MSLTSYRAAPPRDKPLRSLLKNRCRNEPPTPEASIDPVRRLPEKASPERTPLGRERYVPMQDGFGKARRPIFYRFYDAETGSDEFQNRLSLIVLTRFLHANRHPFCSKTLCSALIPRNRLGLRVLPAGNKSPASAKFAPESSREHERRERRRHGPAAEKPGAARRGGRLRADVRAVAIRARADTGRAARPAGAAARRRPGQ